MRSACFRYGFRLGLFPMCRCGDWVSDDCGGKDVACVDENYLTAPETAMRSITFLQSRWLPLSPIWRCGLSFFYFGDVVCLHSAKAIGCDTFCKGKRSHLSGLARWLPCFCRCLPLCGFGDAVYHSFILAMWSAYIRKGRWLHPFRIADVAADVPTSRGGCGVFCPADCSMLICDVVYFFRICDAVAIYLQTASHDRTADCPDWAVRCLRA